MIFLDEGFEWRFEVGWKHHEGLSRNVLEEDSNLELVKHEKSNEEQETLFVDGKEVSKLLWTVFSEVKSHAASKEQNGEWNEWWNRVFQTECFFWQDRLSKH